MQLDQLHLRAGSSPLRRTNLRETYLDFLRSFDNPVYTGSPPFNTPSMQDE